MMTDEYLNRMRGTLGLDWPMEAIEELLNEAVRARNEESRLRAENAALKARLAEAERLLTDMTIPDDCREPGEVPVTEPDIIDFLTQGLHPQPPTDKEGDQ